MTLEPENRPTNPELLTCAQALGAWMAGELTIALQGRAITQQRLLLALEEARRAGGPLADAPGQAFADALLLALSPAVPAGTAGAPPVRRTGP